MTEERETSAAEGTYFWDPDGAQSAPDPEVEKLEQALRTFALGSTELPRSTLDRLRESAPATTTPFSEKKDPVKENVSRRNPSILSRPRFRARRAAPARALRWAALLALASALLFAFYRWQLAASGGWEVDRIAGDPQVDGRAVGARGGRLHVGETLATGAGGRARLAVGAFGEMEVEPGSELSLVAAHATDHRLTLARGEIHARIWAPPRLVSVATASATAVDLGCTYKLSVNDRGEGELAVTMGWVALANGPWEAFVPAGATARILPHRGPGIPRWNDAPEELELAIARLDTGAAGRARQDAIADLLSGARQKDALTVWHLLTRATGAERGPIHDRLAEFAPPPAGVTRDGIVAGDREMLDLWWNALGLRTARWWRVWRQPWPPGRP